MADAGAVEVDCSDGAGGVADEVLVDVGDAAVYQRGDGCSRVIKIKGSFKGEAGAGPVDIEGEVGVGDNTIWSIS